VKFGAAATADLVVKGANFVWDEQKLERFIANPDEMVPGNSMTPYGGMASANSRAKVIAFFEVAGDWSIMLGWRECHGRRWRA
jgi:cytochrome c2